MGEDQIRSPDVVQESLSPLHGFVERLLLQSMGHNCKALTKRGRPCPHTAYKQHEGEWLCHVHNPSLVFCRQHNKAAPRLQGQKETPITEFGRLWGDMERAQKVLYRFVMNLATRC